MHVQVSEHGRFTQNDSSLGYNRACDVCTSEFGFLWQISYPLRSHTSIQRRWRGPSFGGRRGDRLPGGNLCSLRIHACVRTMKMRVQRCNCSRDGAHDVPDCSVHLPRAHLSRSDPHGAARALLCRDQICGGPIMDRITLRHPRACSRSRSRISTRTRTREFRSKVSMHEERGGPTDVMLQLRSHRS